MVSEAIGEIEIERLRETHYDGSRAGRNFAWTVKPSHSFCPLRFLVSMIYAVSSSTVTTSHVSRFPSLLSKRRAPVSMSGRWTT